MRPWLQTTAYLAVLAIAAGLIGFKLGAPPANPACTACPSDPVAWLAREFSPPEEVLAKIRSLHESHSRRCAEHCAAISLARTALVNAQSEAEREAARRQLQQADGICRDSIHQHVTRIADLLGPEQGPRYLALVLPRLAEFDHSGPPGIDLKSTHPHGDPEGN